MKSDNTKLTKDFWTTNTELLGMKTFTTLGKPVIWGQI